MHRFPPTIEELREERADIERRISEARSESAPYLTSDPEISGLQEELQALSEAIGRWSEP